jgi:hypothetical protein
MRAAFAQGKGYIATPKWRASPVCLGARAQRLSGLVAGCSATRRGGTGENAELMRFKVGCDAQPPCCREQGSAARTGTFRFPVDCGAMERHSAIVLETITAIAVVTLVLYVIFGPPD